MSERELPSPELLRQLLRYEPDTGNLFWLPRPLEMFRDQASMQTWNTRFAHKAAFSALDPQKYLSGKIFMKTHRAHRIVWAIHYGEWPNGHIDHINGDRSDNRIENLRAVKPQDNQRNQKLSCRNKTGHSGVRYYSGSGKWRASIRVDGKKDMYLGTFSSKEAAIAARQKAEIENGYHKNHGKR